MPTQPTISTQLGTRQNELLTLLLKNKAGLTIDELTQSLDISRSAVQQHLTALQNLGYVSQAHLTKTGGRPSRTWVLTESGVEMFPKQYSWFAELLLACLATAGQSETLKTQLAEIGRGFAQPFKEDPATPLPQRIEKAAGILNQLGFEAGVSPDSDGKLPVIEAYNCVYHKLAKSHPEICSLDLAILSTVVGAEVEHSECIIRSGNTCTFRFQQGKRDKSK